VDAPGAALALWMRAGRLLEARWFPDDPAREDAHFGGSPEPDGPSPAERAFEQAARDVKSLPAPPDQDARWCRTPASASNGTRPGRRLCVPRRGVYHRPAPAVGRHRPAEAPLNVAVSLIHRARSAPDRPALTSDAGTLSFGGFVDAASRIAGGLRGTHGLAPRDRVVLCMENRPEFLLGLFGCWIGGLCAVPANAKLHPREVAHIVRDSGAAAVLTSESLLQGIEEALREEGRPLPAIVVAGSAGWARLLAAPRAECAEAAPTDLAWIFYTSGTTGRPKGAMLTHRNLTFMSLVYAADIEQVLPGDVKLHAAPLSHASGLYALPHLFAGGHQVVLPGFETDDVLAAFERWRSVTMFAAPTMLTRLVGAAGTGTRAPGLRTLYYGGGPAYVSDLRRALEVFGPRLWQLYGQGESPMTITGLSKADHEGDGSEAHLARLASCGIARTAVEVRVVGEDGRPLAPGEPGEVVTRSDCTMLGYWNNPEASASALRDGWLWTGDLGTLDERGYLTLRDRSKDMIISGGTNIYPREIEEVLLRHPALLECSVVGRPHPDWGEEVVAFVVPRPGHSVSDHDLDGLCLEHIARFKRPRAYRRVAALPKNNYGKVLKTELRRVLRDETEVR
jgi:acyl-CoA synthetase (AMP-forming)/AMP-acid ligase II